MEIQEKLQNLVNKHSTYVEEKGKSHIATCNHYNWDIDIWNHRQTIMDTFRKRGYQVSSSTNHGVLDIIIVKPITLE